MRKRFVLLLLAALPLQAGAATVPPEGEAIMTLRMDGDIQVDKDGRVVSHSIHTPVTDSIRGLVDRAISRWTFEAPTVDGKPAGARSKMRITLTATQVDKDFAVKLDNVVFPSAASGAASDQPTASDLSIAKARPRPRFPDFNVAALVSVDIGVDRSGRIVAVAATQCSVHAVQEGVTPKRACEVLESRSVEAARKWKMRYEPKDGPLEQEPITGTVNLAYFVPGHAMDESVGTWRREWRTAYRRAHWRPLDEPTVGASDVDDGGLLRHSPGLKLREGILGQAL